MAGLLRSAAFAVLVVLAACGAPPEPAPDGDLPIHDGPAALQALLDGNARFVRGISRHDHESPARRAQIVGHQHPFAIVLGCADSRVPPELLFDAGLGDLFVIRVAGNVAGVAELGSIEYGMGHLDTHLVMVLGHEGCGAVTAVVDPPPGKEPRELHYLLRALHRTVGRVDRDQPHATLVRLGVEANVRYQVRELVGIRARVEERRPEAADVFVVGAVYDLESGKVRVIETR